MGLLCIRENERQETTTECRREYRRRVSKTAREGRVDGDVRLRQLTAVQILLLSGPPGLGKTTLAHVVACHAGYDVMEINARYVLTTTQPARQQLSPAQRCSSRKCSE